MIEDNSKYGVCPYCGGELIPVFFTEEEELNNGNGIYRPTGRKRRNVSHLECSVCFKKQCVDGETFAGRWH